MIRQYLSNKNESATVAKSEIFPELNKAIVVVGMIPMVLGELYLLLSLSGDKRNIGGHKKEEVLEDC